MGFDMRKGYEHQKSGRAVRLLVLLPVRPAAGRRRARTRCRSIPGSLTLPVDDFVPTENRYNMLKKVAPGRGRDAVATRRRGTWAPAGASSSSRRR